MPPAAPSNTVEADATLETVIARSGVDTGRLFCVMRGGQQVGTLSMRNVVRALVPTDPAGEGVRAAS